MKGANTVATAGRRGMPDVVLVDFLRGGLEYAATPGRDQRGKQLPTELARLARVSLLLAPP